MVVTSVALRVATIDQQSTALDFWLGTYPVELR